jgi:tRNA(fMet)-specific endonuclease VapC
MRILDTDHVSELRYPNSARGLRLLERIDASGGELVVTTIVTVEEQMRGWLAVINKMPAGLSQVDAYTSLSDLVIFCRKWNALPFDVHAAEQFQRLKAQKIKLNTMDLKIAAIVLRHNATLLSANLRDFHQVPDLSVEDWLS